MIITFTFSSLIIFIVSLFFFIFIYNYVRDLKFKKQKYLSKDTKVLITGGSLGIGNELIYNLISLFNCKIINLDIRKESFDSLNEKYKENITNIECDISKVSDNIIKFLLKNKIKPNEIDIIINNAAIANNSSIENLSQRQMISTIDINLLSPIKIIKGFIDYRKTNPKKIHFVTICSVMSHIISGYSSDYISSKWGLYGFIESVRNEYLFDSKFFFTTICPYAVNTGMFPNPPVFPFLPIIETEKIGKEIVKCIALKEKIKFFPNYIYFPIIIYKLLPCFLSDLIQYFFFNKKAEKVGRRNDNKNYFFI